MSKRKKRNPLTEQQKQAARLFFDIGYHPGQIAAQLGIHRTTVWRWAQRSDFWREIEKITAKWQRQKRREILREMHNTPEYKRRQARRYYARKRLKVISNRLDNAKTAGEHQRLYKLFEKYYNDAYFDGLTPAEYINSWPFFLDNKKPRRKPRKEPKYIITIL